MIRQRLDTEALELHLAPTSEWAINCGANVKSRRLALDLTVRQVADMLGTTTQTVYAVERGKLVVRDHLRLGLAHVLCCDIDDLFRLPSRTKVAEFWDAA